MNIKIKNILPITLLLAVLISSCSKNKIATTELTSTKTIKNRTSNINGLSIFKGVFFQTGNVAKLIPMLSGTSSFDNVEKIDIIITEKRERFQNTIINNINLIQPRFFTNFETEIKSDDYNRIEKSINEGLVNMFKAGLISIEYAEEFKNFLAIPNKINFTNINLNNSQEMLQFTQYVENLSAPSLKLGPLVLAVGTFPGNANRAESTRRPTPILFVLPLSSILLAKTGVDKTFNKDLLLSQIANNIN
jgi:hypothetical protein